MSEHELFVAKVKLAGLVVLALVCAVIFVTVRP